MTEQPSQYRIPRIGWGARLRAVREDIAAMDQRHFADSIGMSAGTYGGHEKRSEVPRSGRLIANSVELRWRVPAEWLLTGAIPSPRDGVDRWGDRDSNPEPDVFGVGHGAHLTLIRAA